MVCVSAPPSPRSLLPCVTRLPQQSLLAHRPNLQFNSPHHCSFLFANHEDVKPLELAAVPLSTPVKDVKRRLREQWPAGLPTDDSVIVFSTQQGQQQQEQRRRRRRRRPSSSAAQPPQTPLTVVSSSSPSLSSPAVAAAAAAPAEMGRGQGGAATDDEEEEEEGEEEEVITPPTPSMSMSRTPPRAVEPGRIRLICLGRGLDDDEKTLKDYHVPVFEEHATPVQVAIRPAGASGGGHGARRVTKALDEAAGQPGNGAGEEAVDPLVCCGCSVM